MEIIQSKDDILKIKADVLVVGAFKGSKFSPSAKKVDKSSGGLLKDAASDEKFEGSLGQSILLMSSSGKIKSRRILLVGLGEEASITGSVISKAASLAAKKIAGFCSDVAFEKELCGSGKYISALSQGVTLGAYQFTKYKSKAAGSKLQKVYCLGSSLKEKEFRAETEAARSVAESVNLVRDLVNEPPVYLTPSRLADVASDVAGDGRLDCQIFDLAEIRSRGMGGLIMVSSGSDKEPRFIHLSYRPKKKSRKSVAVVGKGITFDSGGLCIKPADSMRSMKMDMAGSGVVIGVMKTIAALKPDVEVHGLIAASENMTGPAAYKPDDVFTAYNGKTVEVINTDAEGRLVLSDALSYAAELGVDEIIDLATLTGACMVGLGSYTAGIMGNNQKLVERLLKAAERVGEKIWQLPMDEELRSELDSDVADVKHTGSRMGGAITAAMFLENFVGDIPWAHIDIAGPAYLEKSSGFTPKGGTGFGVSTIVEYILKG